MRAVVLALSFALAAPFAVAQGALDRDDVNGPRRAASACCRDRRLHAARQRDQQRHAAARHGQAAQHRARRRPRRAEPRNPRALRRPTFTMPAADRTEAQPAGPKRRDRDARDRRKRRVSDLEHDQRCEANPDRRVAEPFHLQFNPCAGAPVELRRACALRTARAPARRARPRAGRRTTRRAARTERQARPRKTARAPAATLRPGA